MLIRAPQRDTHTPFRAPPKKRRRGRHPAAVPVIVVGLVALACSALSVNGETRTAAAHPVSLFAASAGLIDCGGGAAPGGVAPVCPGPPGQTPTPTAPPVPVVAPPLPPVAVSPAPISPWPPEDPWIAPLGRGSFHVDAPADGYYWWAFGQCTWWAQNKHRDENLKGMGDAWAWPSGARVRGYHVDSQPVVNATVTFAPGVQGAGGAGHLAHVEAVYPAGWFLISEMNFDWNGGGWGRVDYRYAHTGAGVSFIL